MLVLRKSSSDFRVAALAGLPKRRSCDLERFVIPGCNLDSATLEKDSCDSYICAIRDNSACIWTSHSNKICQSIQIYQVKTFFGMNQLSRKRPFVVSQFRDDVTQDFVNFCFLIRGVLSFPTSAVGVAEVYLQHGPIEGYLGEFTHFS